MSLPVVAIVGRPNVGKSTLFNTLVGRRIAIVEPSRGVTRDRVSAFVTGSEGEQIELVDTGGMGIRGGDVLADDIEEQITYAVDRADVLVFVVDGREGETPHDREIARRLRALGKPLVLVANKVESARDAATAAEFHRLGLGEPLLVSALQKRNTGDLRRRLLGFATGPATAAEPEMKIAIVGRRNVGKSTFVNALLDEKRMIVSELPGTTRDAVDVRFERDGKVFVAIDTAGLRKKSRAADSIEFYGHVRAEESIRRADVVLFLFDAQEKISRVDKQLADYIVRHLKPCVLVVNKWDLARGLRTGDYADYFAAALPVLGHAPMIFVSALRNRKVRQAVELARSLWKQARRRVPTPKLNTVIEELKTHPQRGGRSGKRPRIYYGTQVGVAPPAIVLFVNSPQYFSPGYRRFIIHFLRDRLGFEEVPVRVTYRKAAGRKPR